MINFIDLSSNDMPNSDSDSDSCIMLQLYGTGFARSVVNPSLELLTLKTIEKQKNLNEGNDSYQILRIRWTDK